jgi:hypothetical protein
MKYTLSALALAFSSVVAAAGDLPSGKAAPAGPANYVKICDAYGAGFFGIPGTDTCIKVGGMVRYDTFYTPSQDINKITSGAKAVATNKATEMTLGNEVRGRIDLDSRTSTDYGTLQTVVSARLGRTSGILNSVAAPTGATQSGTTTTPIMEAAYMRWAGFTAGIARDNFQYMPVVTYTGNQHWASFSNGAKQLSYTALLGGGLAATVAIQDPTDTAIAPVGTTALATVYSVNRTPQVNGRIDFDQAWGGVSVMGAWRQANGIDPTGLVYDKTANVWAAGAGAKINLPFIASGDAFYLTANYADGMTEYTNSYGSNKASANVQRDVGGYVINQPSVVYGANGLETVKSWNVGTAFTHFWNDKLKSNFFGSYGTITAPVTSAALVWDGKVGFGDAKMWSAGSNLTYSPVKDFDIGVEGIYSNMTQDVRYTLPTSTNIVTSESTSNWTGRVRVERRF